MKYNLYSVDLLKDYLGYKTWINQGRLKFYKNSASRIKFTLKEAYQTEENGYALITSTIMQAFDSLRVQICH